MIRSELQDILLQAMLTMIGTLPGGLDDDDAEFTFTLSVRDLKEFAAILAESLASPMDEMFGQIQNDVDEWATYQSRVRRELEDNEHELKDIEHRLDRLRDALGGQVQSLFHSRFPKSPLIFCLACKDPIPNPHKNQRFCPGDKCRYEYHNKLYDYV